MSLIKHTLNTVYYVCDLWLSAMPVRFFHLIYPMLVGAVYTAFNALYFINDGAGPGGKPYAYYVMDWRNPVQSTVTCTVGFVTTILVSPWFGYINFEIFQISPKNCKINRLTTLLIF